MLRKTSLAIALLFAALGAASPVLAQEHQEHQEHNDQRGEQRGGEQRGEARGNEQHAQQRPAVRAPPPPFKAHAPGIHPRGATVQNHQVRVMAPKMISREHRGSWQRWSHPEFSRPHYYWNWAEIHSVSCTAEDSYGDQYPVTESAGGGFGIANMTEVEDEALDRCYSESGGDSSCVLATCSHF